MVFLVFGLGFLEIPGYGRAMVQAADTLTARPVVLNPQAKPFSVPVAIAPWEQLLIKARTEFQEGNSEAALRTASAAIRINKRYIPAYHLKVRAYVALGDYESALAVSDSTLMMAETPLNYYYQGWVNELLESPQKAEWAYSKSIRMDTSYVEGYLALARLYISESKFEKAIVLCEKALWIDPGNKYVLLERSRVFAFVHDYFEAIDDASLAIGIDSLYANAYYLRGVYYYENFQNEVALPDLSYALRLSPDNIDALLLRSEIYFRMEKADSALMDARAVVVKSNQYRGENDYADRAEELIQRFFRESNAPVITLIYPLVADSTVTLPPLQTDLELSGIITDESRVTEVRINGKVVECSEVDGGCRLAYTMTVEGVQKVEIVAVDMYQNTSRLVFYLKRAGE